MEWSLEVMKVFLYIRGEYPKSIEAINGSINELKKLNLLGDNILGTDFSFDLGICIGQGALHLWRRNCFDRIYRR